MNDMNELAQERHEAIQASAMNEVITLLKKKNVHPMDAIPALGASLEHILNSVAEVKGWNFVMGAAEMFCKTLMDNLEETRKTTTNTTKPN